MFTFNIDKFFEGVHDNVTLLGQWNKLQRRYVLYPNAVEGLQILLTWIETDARFKCIPQIAYVLATVAHETAREFQPIKERLAKPLTALWWKQKVYSPYYGRGYVQLTWKANYLAEGERLDVGDMFVKNPDAVMEYNFAYEILVGGMFLGRFRRTHTLERYIDCSGKKDYHRARNIVNSGLDRAGTIARLASTFENILNESELKG